MQRAFQTSKAPSSVRARLGALVWTAALVSCTGGVGGGTPIAPTPEDSTRTCAAAPAPPLKFLRELSLDLRGTLPTPDELTSVQTAGVVSDAVVDGMLHSEGFKTQVQEWHRALLWPNLSAFRVRATPLLGSRVLPMWAAEADPANRAATSITYVEQFSPDPALADPEPTAVSSLEATDRAAVRDGFVAFAGTGAGDGYLRGGAYNTGCDADSSKPELQYPTYPPPAGRTTYSVRGTDGVSRSHPYFDADGVPLPFHDWRHCPNYCVRTAALRTDVDITRPIERRPLLSRYVTNASQLSVADFQPMNAAGAASDPHELDPEGAHCPAGFERVVNSCDNQLYNDADRPYLIRRDGYTPMVHYWSGGRAVKTCAYEAQQRERSVYSGQSCAGQQLSDPSCGCGPEGRYCMPSAAVYSDEIASRAEARLRDALHQEPLEIVAHVVDADRDYYDVFRTRISYVNGPLSFAYRQQTGSMQGLELGPPAPEASIPAVPYTAEEWTEYARGPEHAGVLTTPAWLGRFPTWRSRVSQFRGAFMCKPFTPATSNLPAPDDPCVREPNLARRCGCQGCHAALEPLGAWWGRWAERSARYLPPEEFPAFDLNCQQCAVANFWACPTRCRTQYVVESVDAEGAAYLGTLRGYLYRTQEERSRIETGPTGFVADALASGELQRCTVQTVWNRLLGRPATEYEGRVVLPVLLEAFERSGHNYRALVREIVLSDAYRRVD